ncbi:Xaa-Pro aminopeptidase [Malassezia japonica]|uniref:Exocyst complex component Sec8 n=1 Tax=Malassezia japonica TaxID=223818 RepID=A0AAF0JBL3_9BASI|nr:Xaa-Pro aminopeptidase [Malassezia japonica]WFD40365.1 Xaa-Pro aminopeptidase [Malassezia japonica]
MLKRTTGSKRRPQIRHENTQLGTGAGVTEGPIAVPGHNAFHAGGANTAPQPAAYAQGHSEAYAQVPQAAYAPAPAEVPQGGRPSIDYTASARPSVDYHASARPSVDQHASARPSVDGYNTPAWPPTEGYNAMARPSVDGYNTLARPSVDTYAPNDVYAQYAVTPRGSVGDTHSAYAAQARAAVPERPALTPYEEALRATEPVPEPEPEPVPEPKTEPAAPMLGVRDRLRPAPSMSRASPQPAALAPPADALEVGSLTKERQPAALDAVLSALVAAGRKRQTARILRGDSDPDEKSGTSQVMVPQASRVINDYVSPSDDPKFRALNAVLRKLKAEWSFLMDDGFNPLALVLSLLPNGGLRERLVDFTSLNSLIEGTLQGTLDDHYESFAMAITVNHGMIQSLGEAQDHVSGTRAKLQNARDALGARRADLVQMWQRIQSVKEAMRVLALIEQLRNVPDELETLMSEKQFLQATQLLMRSLRMIQREELVEVGATADLRTYLRSQEHSLLEILIEELHNHLYLKSYYCDARWKSYVQGQDALPDVLFGADYAPEVDGGARPTKLARFMHLLRGRVVYDAPEADTHLDRDLDLSADADHELETQAEHAVDEKTAQNPEKDSFLYLEMLLESLARLGKIGYALEMIGQRLPFEVHQLVDATIDEVDRRHDPHRHTMAGAARSESVFFAPSALTASFMEDGVRKSFSLLSAAQLAEKSKTNQHELSALQRDMDTMRDFFWTLFSKLDAMLQGHRVVQDVAGAIFSRADVKDAAAADRASAELGTTALARVWQAVEYEVRALLHDYLSEDTQAVSSASVSAPSLNELLRTKGYERDKSHTLFRMADLRKQQNAVRRSEDKVDTALRTFVPGLVVQDAGPANATYLVNTSTSTRPDEYTGAGHRLLVRPLTFTVSVLFQPTLAFISRVPHVLPEDAAGASARGFGGFLREFVQHMFLPMLEEKVQTLLSTATNVPEAFAAEPAKRTHAARPIVKSVGQVIALVDSLYTMLQVAPFHRASYSRLILMVFVEYYERCNERFKQLVSEDADATHSGGPYVLAATWTQRKELYLCLTEALTADPSSTRALDIRYAESQIERRYAAAAPVQRADLVTSRKRILALGHLQYSIQFILQHMAHLRATDADDERSERALAENELPLPLSAALASRFDEIPRLFRLLGHVVLMTLRVELRLKTLYYLRLAITEGAYIVDAGSLEPDSHVVDLNTELSAYNDMLKETILPEHQRFVLDGLDILMDAVMIDGVRHLRAINRHGVTKMIRNILSLQQNLKNIVAAPQRVDLERSKKFWEMLSREPEQWLAMVRRTKAQHTFEEYKAALDLCLGIDNARKGERPVSGVPLPRIAHAGTSSERDVTQQRYNELLIELHEGVGATM